MEIDIGRLLKNDSSPKILLQVGKEVEGTLVGKDRIKLYIDLSPFGTGVIYKAEILDTPFSKSLKNLVLGTKVKSRVAEMENDEGYIELSLKELNQEAALEELSRKARAKEVLPGKVIDANKGGLLLQVEGMTGFLPSSQLAPEHYPRAASGESDEILKKLQNLIGTELSVKILSVDKQKQSLILSEKAALEGDLKKRLEKFGESDTVQGEVTGVTDFGVFVRFGEGLEGLVHISELDWKLISHPKEILKVGDKVKAKIIKIANNEVSLSIKALKDDPWNGIEKEYSVGKVVKAVVKELHPFGAFAFINDNIHGLVHISQFGSAKRMEQMLHLDKPYDFEITSIEPKDHRMGLKLVDRASNKEPK